MNIRNHFILYLFAIVILVSALQADQLLGVFRENPSESQKSKIILFPQTAGVQTQPEAGWYQKTSAWLRVAIGWEKAQKSILEPYQNDKVRLFIRSYTNYGRSELEKGLVRAGRYLPMIRKTFKAHGLPADLSYLALIESNLNPFARSPKQAVGMWQFTLPTARSFGLRVERGWYDERLDPELSTIAAAKLLGFLFDKYESWELALAAYNSGEGRVDKALAQASCLGFPVKFEELTLPRETRDYVPAFMAMALIYNDLGKHGFEPVKYLRIPTTETLRGPFHTSLSEVAKRVGSSKKHLTRLNPSWRHGYIPRLSKGDILLRLPNGTGSKLISSMESAPLPPPKVVVHRVVRGETLTHISRRYGITLYRLASANNLRNKNRLRPGQPLIIPTKSI